MKVYFVLRCNNFKTLKRFINSGKEVAIMSKLFDIPNRIEAIQSLRFIAAIMVALSHFGIVNEITKSSAFNVMFFLRLFFVISGFVVMISTEQKKSSIDFLLKRLIRLAPLYCLLTLFVFGVAQFLPSLIGYKPSIVQLIKSLFFVPFARETLKDGVVLRPIVGLGHTLQMEMFFATIFALALKISHKYRGLTSGIMALVLAIVGLTVTFEGAFLQFYLNVNCYSLVSFVIGISIYYLMIWAKMRKFSNCKVIITSGIVALASLVSLYYLYNIWPSGILTYIIEFLSYACIIVCATSYSSMKLPVSKFLTKLGNASYSFYLIHYFVISVAERFLHIDSFSWRNISLILIIVALSWCMSYISYYVIEKHFGMWMVEKINQQTHKMKLKSS